MELQGDGTAPSAVELQAAGDGQGPSHVDLVTAQQLLEQNAVAIFKLNGHLMLRRQRGGCAPPSAEERRGLEEAQRCLLEAASLLPPKVLMPPGMAQRLRQRLQAHGQETAAAAPPGGSDGIKPEQGVEEAPPPQQDPQQPQPQQPVSGAAGSSGAGAALARPSPFWQQRQDSSGLLGLGPLLPSGSLLGSVATAGLLQPSQQAGQQQAQGSVGALPSFQPHHEQPSLLVQGLQGSMGGLLTGGSVVLAPPASGEAGGQAEGAGQGMPPMPAEPGTKQDMWLLTHAYSSMTPEQKEKLAAQPAEVRTFVLRARMRKVRDQLKALQQAQAQAQAQQQQQQQAAPAGGAGPLSGLHMQQQQQQQQEQQQQQQQQQVGQAAAVPLGLAYGGWPGDGFAAAPPQPGSLGEVLQQHHGGGGGGGGLLLPPSMPGAAPDGGGDPLQQPGARQLQSSPPLLELAGLDSFRRVPSVGLLQDQQYQQQYQQQYPQQYQQQELGSGPQPPFLHGPPPLHGQYQAGGVPGGGQLAFMHPGDGLLPQQYQQYNQYQQYHHGQQQQAQAHLSLARQPSPPMVAVSDLGSAGMLHAALGQAGGGMGRPPTPPFAAMTEGERMAHLRQLKRRQEEWLERQRTAAAALQGGGGGGGGM